MYSGHRIKTLLRKRRLSVDWLAFKVGYHPSTVSRLINGKQLITEEFACKAADVLEVPVDWLREPIAEPVPA